MSKITSSIYKIFKKEVEKGGDLVISELDSIYDDVKILEVIIHKIIKESESIREHSTPASYKVKMDTFNLHLKNGQKCYWSIIDALIDIYKDLYNAVDEVDMMAKLKELFIQMEIPIYVLTWDKYDTSDIQMSLYPYDGNIIAPYREKFSLKRFLESNDNNGNSSANRTTYNRD